MALKCKSEYKYQYASGTGKTMAAEIMAKELDLNPYNRTSYLVYSNTS